MDDNYYLFATIFLCSKIKNGRFFGLISFCMCVGCLYLYPESATYSPHFSCKVWIPKCSIV